MSGRRTSGGSSSSTRGLMSVVVGALVGIGAAALAAEPHWGLMVYGVPIGAIAGGFVGFITWWAVYVVFGFEPRVNTGRLRLVVGVLLGAVLPTCFLAAALFQTEGRVLWAVLGFTALLGLAGSVAEYRCGEHKRLSFPA